ncbi:MAG: hypothetical protein K2K74_13770, partial [Lachnospiraceae bacterium]|nr:hypothetical protein [Lachnospiraceae bacterium]
HICCLNKYNKNDFGERVFIGDFYTGIGAISIVINNQTNMVEWVVDCGYGHYEKNEKNPHGVLADNIDQFFQAPLPINHRASYRWKIPVSCGFVALQDVFRLSSYRLVSVI